MRRWVNFFARQGHEVTVLDGFENRTDDEVDPRIDVVHYDAVGPIGLPLFPLLHSRRTLRRLLADVRPDVVHAHSAGRYAWQVSLADVHPYVVSAWGSDVLVPQANWRARFWTRLALRRADLVTAVAPFMVEATIRAGARPGQIVEIHHGVDPTRYRPADVRSERLLALGIDRPFIFSPRALRPIYNHETIMRAAAASGATDLLVMSARGADPEYRAAIMGLAHELGMGSLVRVVEQTTEDDMVVMYQAASVVVSAPTSDSFAVTLLEAMACGALLVTADHAPIRAGVGDLIGEYLVPALDHELMAGAMRRALHLPQGDRDRLAAALRGRAIDMADYETNMTRMEVHYRALADGEPVPAGMSHQR